MIRIYNPSHDMVLAEPRRASFTPHKLIQKFEKDLSLLPLWYCEPGDKIISSQVYDAEFERDIQQLLSVSLSDVLVSGGGKFKFSELSPWGINEAVVRSLTEFSANDLEVVETVRELSHRRTTIPFLTEMQNCGLFRFGSLPVELRSIEDVFNGSSEQVVVKVPYSSSGRGVMFVQRNLADNHPFRKRVQSALDQMGSVIVEQMFDKVLDFAVEFELRGDKYVFAGYSVFETSNGAYTGNFLGANDVLRSKLLEFVGADELDKAISVCENMLSKMVSPSLGVRAVGVDMMVVNSGGKMELHPCVEVNLRMTMGFVARLFFDRYVCEGLTGKMEVIRHKSADEARNFDRMMRAKSPLEICGNRIKSGYLRLTCGQEFNVYAVIG